VSIPEPPPTDEDTRRRFNVRSYRHKPVVVEAIQYTLDTADEIRLKAT
jgi:hypothetical protein